MVSMPSDSGWALQQANLPISDVVEADFRFYALGLGLNFVTDEDAFTAATYPLAFLCPRTRAGLCNTLRLRFWERVIG